MHAGCYESRELGVRSQGVSVAPAGFVFEVRTSDSELATHNSELAIQNSELATHNCSKAS